MNKPGDFVVVYGNPITSKDPIDRARLIEKISDQGVLEYWLVEYTNDLNRKYPVLIHKADEPIKVENKS
jgi:hypothetical protein